MVARYAVRHRRGNQDGANVRHFSQSGASLAGRRHRIVAAAKRVAAASRAQKPPEQLAAMLAGATFAALQRALVRGRPAGKAARVGRPLPIAVDAW
jgi:hypothetical protein